MTEFLENPANWAFISLLIFVGVLVYFGIPGVMTKGLDSKRFAIRDELDEARKLREEAQSLLAAHQRKQRDAEAEVAAIVSTARTEAERATADARAEAAEVIERRKKSAEDRIARAEAQAVADIRSYVAAVAIAAARDVVAAQMTPEQDNKLVRDATDELETKLRSA